MMMIGFWDFHGAQPLAEMIEAFWFFLMEDNFWLRSETIVGGRHRSKQSDIDQSLELEKGKMSIFQNMLISLFPVASPFPLTIINTKYFSSISEKFHVYPGRSLYSGQAEKV